MPEENERRKIQRLKKECETLRDKLAETTKKLKDQEKTCSSVDEKERRCRDRLTESLEELADIETKIQRASRSSSNSTKNNTADKELENLLRAANEIDSVTEDQLQLAVAYAAIKRMKRAKQNQEKKRIALSKIGLSVSSKEEEQNTICVQFSGRSCVFNISSQTKFIDVLRQACEYWSMSCTGVLLVDRNQNAYPLNDTIVSSPGGVPSEVTLKKCTLRDLNTSVYRSNVESSLLDSKQDVADENAPRDRTYITDKLPPKRNRVDCLKYTEMIVYLLSWSLLTVVTLVSMDSVEISALHRSITTVLYETSFTSEITGDDVIFSKITSETEFWQWINGPLRSAVSTDGTTSSSLSCPTNYTQIDTSATETIDLGLICYSDDQTYNASLTTSLCNRTDSFEVNSSCVLQPSKYYSFYPNVYSDADCAVVNTLDTSESVCDTAIGFYTLLRFNHLQGPIALQQFRLKSELDSSSEVSCPEPYTAPSYLDLSPAQCYPPFSLDPQTSSNSESASISTVFPSFSTSSCSTSNCTFLQCVDPVYDSYYENRAATQTLRLLGGSQYFPECSFNAYLPAYTTNFDFVVSQIQNTGWLDTRTRALVVRANFYNPSMDVAIAVSGTCEFTAGGSVHCVPALDIMPVKTSVLDWHNTMMLCVVLLLFIQFAIAMVKLSQIGAARYFGLRRSGAAISPVRKGEDHNSGSKRNIDGGPDYSAIDRYVKRGEADDLSGKGQNDADYAGTKLNMIDIVTFGIVIASFAVDLVFANDSSSFLQDYDGEGSTSGFQFNSDLANHYRYVDMQALARLHAVALSLRSSAIFFMTVKIFKYLNLHPQISLLFNAVSMALTELVNVGVLIIIVSLAVMLPLWYLFATISGTIRFRFFDSIYTDFEIVMNSRDFPSGDFFEEQVVVVIFTTFYVLMVMLIYGALVASILSESYIYLLNRVSEDGYFWFK